MISKKHCIMALMIIVLVFLLVSTVMNTPTNGINVTINNNNNNPVSGARVYAYTGTPTVNWVGAFNGTTDSNGNINFVNIPQGSYSVTVPGFINGDGSSVNSQTIPGVVVKQYGLTNVSVSLVRILA